MTFFLSERWALRIHPWNIKMELKDGGLVQIIILFNWVIFRFHINFQGCITKLLRVQVDMFVFPRPKYIPTFCPQTKMDNWNKSCYLAKTLRTISSIKKRWHIDITWLYRKGTCSAFFCWLETLKTCLELKAVQSDGLNPTMHQLSGFLNKSPLESISSPFCWSKPVNQLDVENISMDKLPGNYLATLTQPNFGVSSTVCSLFQTSLNKNHVFPYLDTPCISVFADIYIHSRL